MWIEGARREVPAGSLLPTRPWRTRLRALEAIFWLVAIVCLGRVSLGLAARYHADSRLRQELEMRLSQKGGEPSPAAPRMPEERLGTTGAVPPASTREHEARRTEGALVGRIEIPRVGLNAMIVQGTRPHDLEIAVGHVTGTALPGEPGRVGLAAHRDGIFRGLRDVTMGDEIVVTTPDATHRYRVVETHIVGPRAVHMLDSGGHPDLALVTCYPFQWVGPAPNRLIVVARQSATGGARLGHS